MTRQDALGHVVWHDLFTPDLEASKRFYAELFGVDYVVEHASDFTWHEGPGDFTLIHANGESHGGMISTPAGTPSYWLAYVIVTDVDQAAKTAVAAGTSIMREPFDAPGVGRSCVLRDAHGARICPFVAAHGYPPPKGLFVWDELRTPGMATVAPIYCQVFGWETADAAEALSRRRTVFHAANGDAVAGAARVNENNSQPIGWIPFLAKPDLVRAAEKAASLGAKIAGDTIDLGDGRAGRLFVDPVGAIFGVTSV
jgi:hypothetical protein